MDQSQFWETEVNANLARLENYIYNMMGEPKKDQRPEGVAIRPGIRGLFDREVYHKQNVNARILEMNRLLADFMEM